MKSALILDDDALSRKVCAAILASRRFAVTAVSSAEDAIRACRASCFDLFVADVLLPASSGPHVAVQIHSPGMAILFISGTPIEACRDADLQDLQQLLRTRMDFLQKPFTLTALMSRVENLLSGASALPALGALMNRLRRQIPKVHHA